MIDLSEYPSTWGSKELMPEDQRIAAQSWTFTFY